MGNYYPVAPGMRSIGESGYIPTMYSQKLLLNLYAQTFLTEIANTDYQGDIKAMGDSVIIRSDPTITILDDVPDGANLNFETPQVDAQTLQIDKNQAWGFKTGNVQMKQTDIKNYTDRWMAVAAKYLKIRVETRVLAYMVGQAAAANCGTLAGAKSGDLEMGTAGGTAVVMAGTDIDEKIGDAAQVMDEQNVDPEGRWMMIPAWAANRIKRSKISEANVMGDGQSIIRAANGRLGMVNGFTLYQSNLLPTDVDAGGATCTYMPFGNKLAITFAGQITENDNSKNPFGFGSLWKGQFVYGRKVVKPAALGLMFAKKG